MHIAIIGGGPGGYVAAIRAAQLGASVTLIEREKLGGTCLHHGCIPTKALHQNAQVIRTLQKSEEFGVLHEGFTLDMGKVQTRKQAVTDKLCAGIEQLMKANGITIKRGTASFVSPHELSIVSDDGEETLIADRVVIATGSSPAKPPIVGLDLPGVLTSNEVLELFDIPKSMAIIGGGVIGMELADIFMSLGTDITVLEFLPRILFEVDRDITARLSQVLRREGMKCQTDMRVREIIKRDDGLLEIVAEGKRGEERFTAETVLVATGRRVNTEGLNLDGIGVQFDRKGIRVDDKYETNVEGVFAIGDVTGGIMLAHVASEAGKACVEGILGQKPDISHHVVPAVVFTSPEIATVGLTEEKAQENGVEVSIGRFMFGANSKAVAQGEEFGFVKVVVNKQTGEIIGTHILGPDAGTIIHEAALAIANGLTVSEIENTIHAHPTLSEAFHEAAMNSLDRAIHTVPKRK